MSTAAPKPAAAVAAATKKKAIKRITWPADGSPLRCAVAGGQEVVATNAAPLKGHAGRVRDAAGFYFHLAALKQAGLWGECASVYLHCYMLGSCPTMH